MSIKKPIPYIFYILFLILPLVLTQKTSELFEFNKITVVYLASILILFCWIIQSILERKIIFRRTILDIPIALFLLSQTLSTITSSDFRTSLLGYYSRFNGGLISSVSYSILYFAYVTFMDKQKTKRAIYFLLTSATLVSIWGILEHFGKSFSCLLIRKEFNVACWVQDVQNRVFASLGQPNWLAAFLVAVLPITWALAVNSKFKVKNAKLQFKIQNFWLWLIPSALFFLTLLYTKSRSGFLGFLVADIVFWSFVFLKDSFKKTLKKFLILHFAFLILALASGTPFTKNQPASSGPVLEQGGTESGEIRKIVWRGAIDVWKSYPIFGTGVETFAFAYWQTRPIEHNLTSEWDFTYNKAHNEFLNYAATTGTIGLLAYLTLIIFSIKQIWNPKYQSILSFALLAGYASILITNFFGFSVVVTSLLFFLFPAFAVTLATSEKRIAFSLKTKMDNTQKFFILLILFAMIYTLNAIFRYWQADTLYAEAQSLNEAYEFDKARKTLASALAISPNESNYWMEVSKSTAAIAFFYAQNQEQKNARAYAKLAYEEAKRASDLSPNNVTIKKSNYFVFTDLATIDPQFHLASREELKEALKLAPTDAKLYYLAGLNSLKIGQPEEAIKALEYALIIKPNYDKATHLLDEIKKLPKSRLF